MLAAFLASGANPRVMDFAARHSPAYADFKDDGAFANINTAEDLAMLQAQYAGMQ
jgi:molybdopterin-guanine dinucleotide biosynthesis protein A